MVFSLLKVKKSICNYPASVITRHDSMHARFGKINLSFSTVVTSGSRSFSVVLTIEFVRSFVPTWMISLSGFFSSGRFNVSQLYQERLSLQKIWPQYKTLCSIPHHRQHHLVNHHHRYSTRVSVKWQQIKDPSSRRWILNVLEIFEFCGIDLWIVGFWKVSYFCFPWI